MQWWVFVILLPHVIGDLNFLVIGDWGGLPDFPFSTPIERKTSKKMSITAKDNKAQFVVALGDNFYFDGVKNEFDPRFEETFGSVFNEAPLQIPWYFLAGNHDHHGNVSAQISYSSHRDIWNFPDFWYSKKWHLPESNKTMKLVMLDTVLLCGNSGESGSPKQPTGPENEEIAESQWIWLEEQLKYSRDDYLLVGGHFPVYSIAEHGPTDCLVQRLNPLLEKYHVTAYLCGHDHNLQHLSHSDVHYFVIGAANFIKNVHSHKDSVPKKSLKYYWADERKFGGFAHITVDKSSLKLSFVDSDGVILHSQVIKPRLN